MSGPDHHHHASHEHGDQQHHEHGHEHDHQHGHESSGTTAVATAAAWTELLHAHGLRVTPARLAVLEALRGSGHASPEEVHHTVNAAAITLSTVYRTLDSLTERGLVTHTHLAGHLASYSLASGATHAHLVCRDCGRVSELDDATTAALRQSAELSQGFQIDVPHLSIFGRCADCAATLT